MTENPNNDNLDKLLAAARKAPELRQDEAQVPPSGLTDRVAKAWCASESEPPFRSISSLDLFERSALIGFGLAAAACIALALVPGLRPAAQPSQNLYVFEAMILGEHANEPEWRSFF